MVYLKFFFKLKYCFLLSVEKKFLFLKMKFVFSKLYCFKSNFFINQILSGEEAMGRYDRNCQEEGEGGKKQGAEKVESDRKWEFRR